MHGGTRIGTGKRGDFGRA